MTVNHTLLIAASMRLHRYIASEQWKAAYEAADALDALLGIKRRPTAVIALRGVP